jgi:hypothetical protein
MNIYLVLKWCVKYFSFISLNSLLVVVTITTQNKDFNKGHIEAYRALDDELLQFHQLKWNSNHFGMFYLNAQKLPGFSMHEMQCTHLLSLFYDL